MGVNFFSKKGCLQKLLFLNPKAIVVANGVSKKLLFLTGLPNHCSEQLKEQ